MRAIVYPYKVHAARAAEAAAAAETEGERRQDDGPTYYAGRRTGRRTGGITAADEDDYLARLAKHVPGEVLAAFCSWLPCSGSSRGDGASPASSPASCSP